jgi:hypothetical protein
VESLVAWLDRIENADAKTIGESLLRVFVPGQNPLDLNDWLIATTPIGNAPPGIRSCFPEAISVIRFPDKIKTEIKIQEHQRLALEFAVILSLALDRRIDIPQELPLRVKGQPNVLFAPFSQNIDRRLLGPLPESPKSLIARLLAKLRSLQKEDLRAIGAAASLYHGALLLSDRDFRAAYSLLIATIEVLSRTYGAPPTIWAEWEECNNWENFIKESGLNDMQAALLRSKLMDNRQLRLKATFRSYAANRIPATFWEAPWIEWEYGIDFSKGQWMSPTILSNRQVREFLDDDRAKLSRSLGMSYDLRSTFVHKGHWLGLHELGMPYATSVSLDSPLPFALLRAIAAELLLTEIQERGGDSSLPSIRISRPAS